MNKIAAAGPRRSLFDETYKKLKIAFGAESDKQANHRRGIKPPFASC